MSGTTDHILRLQELAGNPREFARLADELTAAYRRRSWAERHKRIREELQRHYREGKQP